MSLKRKIRRPPPIPTAEQLRRLLKKWGMQRWRAAELMCVAPDTLDKYLKPATSRHRRPIPIYRFKLLKRDIGKLNDLYT